MHGLDSGYTADDTKKTNGLTLAILAPLAGICGNTLFATRSSTPTITIFAYANPSVSGTLRRTTTGNGGFTQHPIGYTVIMKMVLGPAQP